MKRRHFLLSVAAIPALPSGANAMAPVTTSLLPASPGRRVRPGDPAWPSAASWDRLKGQVGGRLIKVQSPVAACRAAPGDPACAQLFKQLKNPYYIGDDPALTQSSGWVGAWTSAPSVYAVAAENTQDVVAAVNFAREHNLRLVVKRRGP